MSWLFVVFFALAVANGLILPSFEAIDEPVHFNFVHYLAQGNQLPDQRDFALAEKYGYGQEGGQPPLYYVLSAFILQGLGESMAGDAHPDVSSGWVHRGWVHPIRDVRSDVAALTRPNPLSTCGDTSQSYSKGLWMRDPQREMWPYRGAALGVHVLRLFSAILGLVTIGGVYLTARTVFPKNRAVHLVAAALVGFSPRFLTHSAAITNDSLVTALAAWGVYLTADTLRRGPSVGRSLALGAVIGLAMLTKVSGLFLLPLAALALADVAWCEHKWRRSLGHLILIALVAVAIAGWWYVGNLLRYGNPGLVPLLTQETGQRTQWPPHLVIPETLNFLRTYWAAEPYCEISLGFLPVYGLLNLVGLVGLARLMLQLQQASPPTPAVTATRRGVALLAIWAGVTFAAWFQFNAMVWAPDGRYLFQAHAAIAPLLAAGLMTVIGELIPHATFRIPYAVAWRGLVIGLGALAFVTPVQFLAPLFNPPPRYPVAQVHVPHPLDASFGGQVALLGYEVSDESVRAGDAVDVTLYLKAERPITESLMLGLQMVVAAPGDNDMLVNLTSWPGGGNYPTPAWRPDEVLADRYRLRIPDDVRELQLWELRLIVLHPSGQDGSSGEAKEADETIHYVRLPVWVGGVPGEPYVVLTRLRVEPRQVLPPPAEAVLCRPPAFGPHREVVLEAVEIRPEGTNLHVTLWWRARRPLGQAYTVFVHLLDDKDHPIEVGDGLPRGGAMPTDQWRAGDLILDEHHIPLPEGLPTEGIRVGVGFYDADLRLPAWDVAGRPLPESMAVCTQ